MTDPIAGLNAALSDRYVIDRELGRGGMAMVYLARDLKHERFVALKTLRPEIAMALGRERFLREIKLAARLQHPNILAVYDSGDAAGALYYVMPYVEGESLRDRLEREPQLPLDDALQIAREVADALSYAHGHDVVHRDIKPENIMLSGGHAIVADFGIARAVSAAGGDKLTETGLAIGTPAYMSPEQAAGTGQVDRRSDIYSLACVLYETLAGQPPFTGPTAQAIMARHSLDSVPRLRIVRETIPDALEDVIKRALAKVPADRYATAAQFAEALAMASTGRVSPVTGRPSGIAPPWQAWRKPIAVAGAAGLVAAGAWLAFGRSGNARPPAGGEGLDPRRVAVLYFVDRTRDTALAHLADALTEGLIDQLQQVQSLDVVSRNGVARFQREDAALDSVARELSVGTLVRGEVERQGDRVRVTVRLVDGGSGADFNRQTFALPVADALGMRDSLAQQAALLLRQRLGEEVRLREQQAGTRNVTAWSLVQRAERTRKDAEARLLADDVRGAFAAFQRSDTLLEQAERADPDWVEPIVLRGQIAYRWSRIVQGEPQEAAQWIATSLEHAGRALTLEANNAPALELRGTLRYYHYLLGLARTEAAGAAELRSARQDLEAAVRERPSLASAYSTLSHLYFRTEDVPSGLLAARRAYEADAYLTVANEVVHRLFLGSYDSELHSQARQWCDVGTRRFPRDYRFTECQLWLLTTPAGEPDPQAAWRLLARLDSLAPAPRRDFVHRHGMILLAAGLGRAGLRDSARSVLLRARADRTLDPGLDLVGLEAFARTLIGDRDEAISLLKQYLAANPEHLFQPSGDVHWWWRNLQGHPAFQTLVRARQ